MPTYADLWNEQQRALGQSGPSNPVRLTISKGGHVWDPQSSRFRYEEQWEEEHLMEDEELLDTNLPTATHLDVTTADSREASPPSLVALHPTILDTSGLQHHASLWVLDTNTLMSCLELLKALFASLLTRNVAYANSMLQRHYQAHSSTSPATPSSIKLVIPHVVVSELDGLKLTRRKDDSGRPVASQAREANHWLLSALQKQKRVTIGQVDAPLSQDLWPLFIQPTSHYSRSRRSNGYDSRWDFNDPISCDDEIVSFCVQLKQQTASHVRFCSDDINARTKAERDDIDSLGMRELANALKLNFKHVQSTQQRWMCVADALIEQWEYQIGATDATAQREHHHYDQQHVNAADPRFLQSPLNVLATAPDSGHQNLIHRGKHAPPSPGALGYHGPAIANNGIIEVEMDTEGPQEPRDSAFPSPPSSPSSRPTARSAQRGSPSYDGRSTNHSIHSPQNARQVEKARNAPPPATLSQPFLETPAGVGTADEQSGQALNPQVDWEDLVQQFGSRSAQTKQRNGRW